MNIHTENVQAVHTDKNHFRTNIYALAFINEITKDNIETSIRSRLSSNGRPYMSYKGYIEIPIYAT